MQETIGWIGLGSMGHRMSRHLGNAGYPLLVADAASTERAPKGASIAQTNAEVAVRAATIFLSLPDGVVSQTVARELATAPDRQAKTVIDTSTIGIAPQRSAPTCLPRAASNTSMPRSPAALPGPTRQPSPSCWPARGPRSNASSRCCALMGKPFYVGPKPGQAQAVKVLNNFLSATALAATSEAIAFGTEQGIDMKTILDVVNASSGRNSATEDKFLNRILHGRYDAGFTAKLQLKDIRLYLEAARAAGIADQIASAVVDQWQRMEASMPGADITDMYRYTRQRGKLERG